MGKKLRVGVFGAARGFTMINVLLVHPDATLVAVCDKYRPGLDRVEKAAKAVGMDVALYEDFEEFFKHDMDAVVLANYANEHAPFAIRLLKSGRHVLSEVLPCQTMAEAVQLIEAVEETGKVYAYAENYCYMLGPFEMWQRYERGDIGEVMYGEGEYVHDCAGIWPDITYGEKEHWRNRLLPTFYCTHSLGPLLTITGRRPVRVNGLMTNQNVLAPRQGARQGECAAMEMVTLDNGAVLKSLHGHLKREPGSINYEVYGMKGSMETQRFLTSKNAAGDTPELQVYIEDPGKVCEGKNERYVPARKIDEEMSKVFTGHGGSDFYATHFFIEKILGRPEGQHYSIDVYKAVDMGICGILAYRSILNGGAGIDVPDLRDPAQRDAWRSDNICPDPKVAGDQLISCLPTGNIEYTDEEYEAVRQEWLRRIEARRAKEAAEEAEKAGK